MKNAFLLIFMVSYGLLLGQDSYQGKFSFGTTSGWCKLAHFDLAGNGSHNSVIIDAHINYVRTSEKGYSANAKLILREGSSNLGKWNYNISGTEIGDYLRFKKINDTTYELFGKSQGYYGHISIELSVTKEATLIIDIPNTITLVTDPDIYQDVPKTGDFGFFSTKVGIGTTSPDAKLAVKGNIHAEEVKVDLSVPGPDYVFKEGYDLKSLGEVQNYIKENGHLPNIPSAKEMEKNGVQLGVMNMKLLEKIEELILYTIQQERRLKIQEQRLYELEKSLIKQK
ncbi:hypothetical protein [Maribacter sp. 2304DJ31-5]|uniref:hypothetical protein n=1 Tax=Maribacter sp. 2304DJ31-5 TaxID=3386273 RepID=UPI0039BC73EA